MNGPLILTTSLQNLIADKAVSLYGEAVEGNYQALEFTVGASDVLAAHDGTNEPTDPLEAAAYRAGAEHARSMIACWRVIP